MKKCINSFLKKKVEDQRKQIADLKRKNVSLEAENVALKTTNSKMQRAVSSMKIKFEKLQKDRLRRIDEMNDLKREYKALHNSLSDLKHKYANEMGDFLKEMRAQQ